MLLCVSMLVLARSSAAVLLTSGGSYQFEEAEARAGKTCVDARDQALRRKDGRFDPRNVLTSLSSATPELLDALSYKTSFKSRKDWVPSLTQSLYANTAMKGGAGKRSGLLRPLPGVRSGAIRGALPSCSPSSRTPTVPRFPYRVRPSWRWVDLTASPSPQRGCLSNASAGGAS
jgi:hypothetical protein